MSELTAIDLSISIGGMSPQPLSLDAVRAVQSVQVVRTDNGPATVQIAFNAERGLTGEDYDLLSGGVATPFNRILLEVSVGSLPIVLFDGFVTHQQLAPGDARRGDTLTITGEDVSVLMDLVDNTIPYPALTDTEIVALVLGKWDLIGIVPEIVPPASMPVANPETATTIQNETDRAYLQRMAQTYGYVFHVRPTDVPLTNTGYWGPPLRLEAPQPALSVDFGPFTNVDTIDFAYDALAPTLVFGSTLDPISDEEEPVVTVESTRLPPLAAEAALDNLLYGRKQLYQNQQYSGIRALVDAQAITDTSTDNVVTVNGTLDAVRYGGILEAPGLVGLRGAGTSYDGLYYVKQVTHKVAPGSYKQDFVLTREGLGTTTEEVRT